MRLPENGMTEAVVAVVASLVVSRLLLLATGFMERLVPRLALVALTTLICVAGLSLVGQWVSWESRLTFVFYGGAAIAALELLDYVRLSRRRRKEAYRPQSLIDLERASYREKRPFILANPRDMVQLAAVTGVLALGCMWAAVDWNNLWIGALALALAVMAEIFVAGLLAERDLRRASEDPQANDAG